MLSQKKYLLLLGFFIYAVLLVGAIWFFKERTIFVDIAFHTFHFIVYKQLLLSNLRFAGAFTQGIPFVLIQLGASLKTILIAYSLDYWLFYFLCFIVIAYGFKNTSLAFLQALYLIFLSYDSFYWMQSELQLVASLIFVYVAYLLSLKNNGFLNLKYILFNILFLIILIFSHPLAIIPLMFVIIYFLVANKINTHSFLFISVASICIYLTKKYFFSNAYDDSISLDIAYWNTFPNWIWNPCTKNFLHYLLTDYFIYAIIGLFTIIYCVIQRKWLPILLLISFSVGLILMVSIAFHDGGEKFYFDNFYKLLGLFLLVIIYVELEGIMLTKLGAIIMVIIVLLRLNLTYTAHESYSERLNWLYNKINGCKKSNISRLSILPNRINMNQIKMTWGLPYESMLYSALLSPNKCVALFVPDKECDKADIENYLKNDTANLLTKHNETKMLTNFEAIDDSKLPPKYFNLKQMKYQLEK